MHDHRIEQVYVYLILLVQARINVLSTLSTLRSLVIITKTASDTINQVAQPLLNVKLS